MAVAADRTDPPLVQLDLGMDYQYHITLGSAFRVRTSALWQILDWLSLEAGLRFTVREGGAWTGDPAVLAGISPAPWNFSADTQFLDLKARIPVAVPLDAGLQLMRSGFPDSQAMYLALIPWNLLDLGVAYLKLGLCIRSYYDPDLAAEHNNLWETEVLVRLGTRLFLAGKDTFLRLEINTGSDYELANLQAIGFELCAQLPLDRHWQLEPLLALRLGGAFSLAATPMRFQGGLTLRSLLP